MNKLKTIELVTKKYVEIEIDEEGSYWNTYYIYGEDCIQQLIGDSVECYNYDIHTLGISHEDVHKILKLLEVTE